MLTLSEVYKICGKNITDNRLVKGITDDSNKIKEGYIFVAKQGINHSGLEFCNECFSKGAILVINDEKEDFNVIKVSNLKEISLKLAKLIYGLDFNSFFVVGITGTNGKTTSTSLIYKMLLKLDKKATLIGTNGVYYPKGYEKINNTTPDSLELYRIFYNAKMQDCDIIIMEVSSHALSLNRLQDIRFDIVGFTNISHDHLDFHKSIEEYAKAKFKICEYLKENGKIIANFDDERIAFEFTNKNVISYGIKNTDYIIKNIELTEKNTSFIINNQCIKSNLVCLFNVYNLTLAMIVLLNMFYKIEEIIKAIDYIDGVDGRMEKICINNRHFYIDFAHTPDAIDKVLFFIKTLVTNKLHVIFGSGGNRDKLKRPKMLEVVSKYADSIYVTSDNPRYEDPFRIMLDIISKSENPDVLTFLSRDDAIKEAYKNSNENDVIVILGKGNETYQIIEDIKIPYSDKEVILNVCKF